MNALGGLSIGSFDEAVNDLGIVADPILHVVDAMALLNGQVRRVSFPDFLIGGHLVLEPMGVHKNRHYSPSLRGVGYAEHAAYRGGVAAAPRHGRAPGGARTAGSSGV